jgi:hypothetical protein
MPHHLVNVSMVEPAVHLNKLSVRPEHHAISHSAIKTDLIRHLSGGISSVGFMSGVRCQGFQSIFAMSRRVAGLPRPFLLRTRSNPLFGTRETALRFAWIFGAVRRGVLCTRLAWVMG